MAELANMSDEEFQQHTMRLISRELGADGLARFIRLNRSGRGDYTRDRHQWLDKVSIEELYADLETPALEKAS